MRSGDARVSWLRWRVLRDGTPETAIAFDYDNGRKQAGFADLAELLPGDHTLLELEFGEADGAGDRPLDPEVLCRNVLADLRAHGRSLGAALGYCAGAGLACLLAQMAAESGSGCRVVLLDPLLLDSSALARAYASSVEAIRTSLDDSDYRAALDGGERVLPGGSLTAEQWHRMPAIIDALSANYAWAVRRSGAMSGVPAELREQMAEVEAELVSCFTTYAAYLATTMAVDLGASWSADRRRPPVVLASQAHEIPGVFAPFLRRRFDIPQSTLLRDHRVAAVVGELLSG
jgi:hypothetical protein